MTDSGVPRSVLKALGEASIANTEQVVADVLAGVGRLWPALADHRSGLADLLAEVVTQTHTAMGQLLITGELTALPAVPPAAQHYAQRLAELDASAESVGALFQIVQRMYLRQFMSDLAGTVPATDFVAYLPQLVDVAFAHGEVGYCDAARAYAEARAWRARRSAAEFGNRLALVLNDDWADEAAASKLLDHPMAGLHIGMVIQADDEASLDQADIRRRLGQLRQLREVLVVPTDERTVAAWGKLTEMVDVTQWAAELADPLTIRAGVGEIGRGVAGFRSTHRQARQAFRVANLVPDSHRIANYREVAPVAFLADDPQAAQLWVAGVLGELAEPGEDKERLRTTLHHYLASGENPGVVAERLFVHRNTVGYRVNKAVAMLPAGLDDHRLDVALALNYLYWS
ncbi:MAG: PucR family transcriptional regulator [Brooklawnia sp.]|jgi:hypothetical protein